MKILPLFLKYILCLSCPDDDDDDDDEDTFIVPSQGTYTGTTDATAFLQRQKKTVCEDQSQSSGIFLKLSVSLVP